ncbi:hypothetical protein PENTCL1PPCAC_17201 [Pristionchus entomophagus]|uniref:Nuclear receptor n=1 Tax=Pristionchus entomophagus TaxID=358040 RepID=A0AAV5TL23_9BILA|nr:hypothetical protein PENTCL1PPCAC_17201 [Pristionchus entomophagus]
MEERSCLICTSPITSTHFGLDACRACCLFFKRTKLAGRKFDCPGKGNCIIKKDDNTTCRKCRFDRCVEVGMEYEGPLRKPRKMKEVKKEIESSSSSFEQSPSTSSPRPSESILERIDREYKVCTESRLIQEKNLHIIFTLPRVPHISMDLFLSNLSFSKKSFKITIFECLTFVRKAFPTITQLLIEEQRSVLKNFVIKFSIIEGHYRTVKLWNDDRYYMSSLTTCFDISNKESWLPESEMHKERKNLLGTMKSYTTDQFSIIFPTLRKAELTDVEFHGLLALAFCDLADVDKGTKDRVMRLVDSTRMETFSDLQRYYTKEMNLTDYSTRIGNLVTLIQLVKESARLMQEEFRMYTTIFDLYANEEMLKELLL